MRHDGGLRAIFHDRLKRYGDWTPIESGLTAMGVPDSNFCIAGAEGWIEFKRCLHWKVSMRPEQIGWAERRMRHGGRVFLAVWRAEQELWLLTGWAARVAKVSGLREVPKRTLIGVWEGPPADWPWKTIAKCLKNNNFISVRK